MTETLAQQSCKPCRDGESPLTGDDVKALAEQLSEGWQVVDEHHLIKAFKFNDFRQSLDFTNRVGEMAEEQGHHPDIYLSWGMVEVKIWTHKVGGLSESDFIFAARTDAVR